MSELAAMRHIIRAEEDADITVKFWGKALSGATRPAGLTVLWQVLPPQRLRHAFL